VAILSEMHNTNALAPGYQDPKSDLPNLKHFELAVVWANTCEIAYRLGSRPA